MHHRPLTFTVKLPRILRRRTSRDREEEGLALDSVSLKTPEENEEKQEEDEIEIMDDPADDRDDLKPKSRSHYVKSLSEEIAESCVPHSSILKKANTKADDRYN